MVRIVSQHFSPPRSRHSSGETDRYLAERTELALSTLGRKRTDAPEYESSSDSFWDSEFDCDHFDAYLSEGDGEGADTNGNGPGEKSDTHIKRKQHRRERNKLSAQAYRQRRRHQNVKEQQQLMTLGFENKRLHKLVETLEKKTEEAKQYLRGCSVPMPDILTPMGEEGGPDCVEEELGVSFVDTSGHFLSGEAGRQISHQNDTTQKQNLEPSLRQPLIHSFHNPPAHLLPIVSEKSNILSQKQYPADSHQAAAIKQSTQVNPTVVPIHPKMFINAQPLIGTPVNTNENLNGTATAPTYHPALPVETATQCFTPQNLNAMTNVNQGFNSLPQEIFTTSMENSDSSNWSSSTAVLRGPSTAVLGTVWNGQHPIMASLNGNSVFSFIKIKVCNNLNENNINVKNDRNGNQNSCDTMTMTAVTPQFVPLNLNLNQAPSRLHTQLDTAPDLGIQESGVADLSQVSTQHAAVDQALECM